MARFNGVFGGLPSAVGGLQRELGPHLEEKMGIRVIVSGAAGRMGSEVCRAVVADPDTELVGAVDANASAEDMNQLRTLAGLEFSSDLTKLLDAVSADVLVDFTIASVVMGQVKAAVSAGLHAIIGTTGLSAADIEQLEEIADTSASNILLAPNFAIGAVLMMRLAATAAPFADRAEIIEMHHDKKIDAPSGTARLTAEMIGEVMEQPVLEEEEKIEGVRGGLVAGIPVHSVRLPGFVAHQEVIFGFQGQTLTIRHDSTDRTSFMPGVILAVKQIAGHRGFTYGLDKMLGL